MKKMEVSDTYHVHEHTAVGNIRVAFFTNLVFTLIELVGGWLTNSMAIVGESFHDLGCTLTLGLSWIMEKKNHQLTGAVLNAVVLFKRRDEGLVHGAPVCRGHPGRDENFILHLGENPERGEEAHRHQL